MAPVVQAVPVEHRGSAGLVDIQEIQEPVELRVRPVFQEQAVPVVRQDSVDTAALLERQEYQELQALLVPVELRASVAIAELRASVVIAVSLEPVVFLEHREQVAYRASVVIAVLQGLLDLREPAVLRVQVEEVVIVGHLVPADRVDSVVIADLLVRPEPPEHLGLVDHQGLADTVERVVLQKVCVSILMTLDRQLLLLDHP